MRVGRIGYINCYPVYGALDRGVVPSDAEFVTGTPAELNGLLVSSALDLSVISAVEYARFADRLLLLPDLAISCDGPVRSVVLFAREPVERLEGATILTSAASRTSVYLLRLLMQDVWGIDAELVAARTEAPDLADLKRLPHDAVLVIGDAALLLAATDRYPIQVDLGEVWKQWTGLPFVFAVWAARRGCAAGKVRSAHEALLKSRDWGLAHLGELAQAASVKSGLTRSVCEAYLSGLDYGMSSAHMEGLTSFFRRLATRGMVPDGALRFLSVA